MSESKHQERETAQPSASPSQDAPSGGERTLLGGLAGQMGSAQLSRMIHLRSVQRKAREASGAAGGSVEKAAALGTSGAGGALPHQEAIKASFGKHDISGIKAHTDDKAAAGSRAMGAEAFATGNHVAFDGAPSLHTAAHEAAHVIQQQQGVHLKGGVGQEGDAHERHADAVADLVVRGQSAERLLGDRAASPGAAAGAGVQRKVKLGDDPVVYGVANRNVFDTKYEMEIQGLSPQAVTALDALMARPETVPFTGAAQLVAEGKTEFKESIKRIPAKAPEKEPAHSAGATPAGASLSAAAASPAAAAAATATAVTPVTGSSATPAAAHGAAGKDEKTKARIDDGHVHDPSPLVTEGLPTPEWFAAFEKKHFYASAASRSASIIEIRVGLTKYKEKKASKISDQVICLEMAETGFTALLAVITGKDTKRTAEATLAHTAIKTELARLRATVQHRSEKGEVPSRRSTAVIKSLDDLFRTGEEREDQKGGGAPRVDDIKQGTIGDCYLLSALISVAQSNPGHLKGMFRLTSPTPFKKNSFGEEPTGDGSVSISFYRKDKLQAIEIPTHVVNGGAEAGPGFPPWVAFLELAYMKFVGGAEEAKGGQAHQAFSAIYGPTAAAVRQDETTLSLASITADLAAHKHVVISTKQSAGGDKDKITLADGTKLNLQHAYAVSAVDATHITILNPHKIRHRITEAELLAHFTSKDTAKPA